MDEMSISRVFLLSILLRKEAEIQALEQHIKLLEKELSEKAAEEATNAEREESSGTESDNT